MKMEFEKFYGVLWKNGNSFVVTIPSNIVKGLDLKEGSKLKFMMNEEK